MNTVCAFYSYHYCGGVDCSRYTDCDSCISDPQCGWCRDSSRVMEVCLEGDENFKGLLFDNKLNIKLIN